MIERSFWTHSLSHSFSALPPLSFSLSQSLHLHLWFQCLILCLVFYSVPPSASLGASLPCLPLPAAGGWMEEAGDGGRCGSGVCLPSRSPSAPAPDGTTRILSRGPSVGLEAGRPEWGYSTGLDRPVGADAIQPNPRHMSPVAYASNLWHTHTLSLFLFLFLSLNALLSTSLSSRAIP